MKLIKLIFVICVAITNSAFAQINENPEEIHIFAKTCEKISNGESKSSARLRASDKASFKAIEEIPELKQYREYLDPHQFNLKVYKLVDNHLEDMNINVVSQDMQEVCVEISAYIVQSSISEVFKDITLDGASNTSLEIEESNVEENVNIIVPPKPEININDKIAYNDIEPSYSDENDENIIIKKNHDSEKNNLTADKKISIFVDKTMFYNNTSTKGFFAHIEQEILKKDHIEAQAEFTNPDYILKTNVLKAKVDNINSETARLHIIVGIELLNTSNSETITEHQNRFILFNTSEDAQAKAAELVKKLLSDGIAKILPLIKQPEKSLSSDEIITPPEK